ncbi:MAG TPA: Hsp20/alpha crystallin family protein [Bacillales bacterium]|nr:Hsp20/alpha crystallin family protein [Bacillales bacterium]
MADQFNPWDFVRQQTGESDSSSGIWSDPNMSWVQDYVENVMNQAFQGQFKGGQHRNGNIKSNVFETHHSMIIRMDVPEDIVPENVKILFNTNELKVEGIDSQPEVFKLPRNGLYKGSKAIYKNRVLEIRIPKRSREQFQEIPIQF